MICFYFYNCGGTRPQKLAPDSTNNQKSIEPVAPEDNKLLPVVSKETNNIKSKVKPGRNNSITSKNVTADNSKSIGSALPNEATNKVMN